MKPLIIDNPDTIEKEYPKAFRKLTEWTYGIVQDANKGESVNLDEKYLNQLTKSIIFYQGRSLFDFFDSFGVYIAIVPQMVMTLDDNNPRWIHYNSKGNHSSSSETRQEAEKDAILEAFKTLEEIL